MTTAIAVPPLGVAAAAALVAGALACLRLPSLPLAWLCVVLMAAGMAAWWRLRGRWRWAGALVAGFALCGLHAGASLGGQLPASQARGDFTVSGRVTGLPEVDAKRTRFQFRVDDDPALPDALRGARLRLSWYDNEWSDEASRRYELQPGAEWRLQLRLRAPRGLRNPGGFDAERHAMAARIVATGYVREQATAEALQPARGIDAWRDRIARRIDESVPSGSARYVRALALGDTRGLEDVDWELLRATGLTHLIAISGFHVGLVAGFFALLGAALWRLFPALCILVPRPQAAAAVAFLGALGYAAVAGFALPTVRTVLMIAVAVAARLWRRPLRISESLALAAIAIVLVDPLALLSAGFWLSFGGVAWLLWCLPQAGGRPLRDFLSAQWVATLGLLPMTAILFGQASLAGPFANLVAIPWWSLVVVPLSLLGTALEGLHTGWGGGAWRLAAAAFDLSWPLFERLGGSPLALAWLPEPPWFALPMALLAAFWLLLPRGVPGRSLALLLWLPLLWPDRQLPRHGEVELVMLDVGQGLSVLVRTAGHAALYDMGPATPDGFDAGERTVVPALHALGVRRLDILVASHADADHAGGLDAVRRRFPAPVVLAPEGAGIEGASGCLAGSGWQRDGVSFRFLHPPLHFPYLRNESSCVLRIETAHGAVLLTGDIGEAIEERLAGRFAEDLPADVVLVPHHGSRHSSTAGFVAATSPRLALVSAGHGNRFGHPDAGAVARWERGGAEVLATPAGGAIRVRLAGQGVVAGTERKRRPRFWDAVRMQERQ
ncbi:DNA internalization-related competence protein ComEC/Rec2 [Luteimonas arsenica]|uniref:DNA internalization-related competence protein ComEC/Rec2 n=1 Tax=Luteimonas arsenica TaxID=1586242 RepID=UPI001054BFAD|nr:DNA internalization-related competence protein ComEC/Rec2 [Luteimonas arsenica]